MTSSIAYLGCLNKRNLGDESVWLATRQLLPSATRVVPFDMQLRPVGLRARFIRPRPPVILLGGGTLVGRWLWLEALEGLAERLHHRAIATIGVGVEDPRMPADAMSAGPELLARWATLLRRFSLVTVRGPRSSELLDTLGVPNHVVGDAALSLGVNRPEVQRKPQIALNLSSHEQVGESLWETHDRIAIANAAVREWNRQGLAVKRFAMSPDDVAVLRSITGPGVQPGIASAWRHPGKLLELLSASSLTVSQRLHGAVLSAAVGTPFLLLAYRPKAFDFAASISAEARVLRLDQMRAETLVEQSLECVSTMDALVTETRAHVRTLVVAQQRAAETICEHFSASDERSLG